MKSSSSNSFSFRCAVCRKACQPLHIVVVVMASFFNRRQHFCSVRCAASWLDWLGYCFPPASWLDPGE